MPYEWTQKEIKEHNDTTVRMRTTRDRLMALTLFCILLTNGVFIYLLANNMLTSPLVYFPQIAFLVVWCYIHWDLIRQRHFWRLFRPIYVAPKWTGSRVEMENWLEENIPMTKYLREGGSVGFARKTDAVMFKLVWG